MNFFDRIPNENLFSILSSPKKRLYLSALFVLRDAFREQLAISKSDLITMLEGSLENEIMDADFTEEAEAVGDTGEEEGLSARAYLLLRRLRETGWLDIEMEARSFEEYITVPDYAIAIINLLYELSQDKTKEYNGYVYTTYAALVNTENTPDYRYTALTQAYRYTEEFLVELKSLYNNINRYFKKVLDESDVNALLAQHFDEYQVQIVDAVIYPLKTIDSVPRFRHAILEVLNRWASDDTILSELVDQGIERNAFEERSEGMDRVLEMINFVADTYEGIESLIDEIERKHAEYTNSSIDKIRYRINADRSAKGKLVDLLKKSDDRNIFFEMQHALNLYQHHFLDHQSQYNRVKRARRTEGKPLAIKETAEDPSIMREFLSEIRQKYTDKKIDAYAMENFGNEDVFYTETARVSDNEEFILFLLMTIRGREKTAPFSVTFFEGNTDTGGYSLPKAEFRRKHKKTEDKK